MKIKFKYLKFRSKTTGGGEAAWGLRKALLLFRQQNFQINGFHVKKQKNIFE